MSKESGQSPVENLPDYWLLTADRRNARLLRVSVTPHRRLHIEPEAEVEEEWTELQHGRPSPRTGKDNHAYASPGHEDEERVHRFAKTVAHWLESEIQARQVSELHAFAAPRFLGQLRRVLASQVHEKLTEHALNLCHLSPGELAVHEAVVAAAPAIDPPQKGNSVLRK